LWNKRSARLCTQLLPPEELSRWCTSKHLTPIRTAIAAPGLELVFYELRGIIVQPSATRVH